jgi:hypothetical protein
VRIVGQVNWKISASGPAASNSKNDLSSGAVIFALAYAVFALLRRRFFTACAPDTIFSRIVPVEATLSSLGKMTPYFGPFG